MELSEVVNVQVAFPVVGVVLCAVLVFAFGFKSPVQPPSFDVFDDGDRKTKRARQRRAVHSDKHRSGAGVVDSLDGRSSPAGTKSPSNSRQSPQQQSPGGGTAGRGSAGKIAGGAGVTPDTPNSAKAKPLKAAEEPDGQQTQDATHKEDKVAVGEWTTALSKKERKNRGRRDDNGKSPKSVSTSEPSKAVGSANNTSGTPTSASVKSNKKMSEMATVTVIVPAPPTGHSSQAAATTSTTITQSAVIKVKVVPSVRVSAGTDGAPNHPIPNDRKTCNKLSTADGGKTSDSVSSSSSSPPTTVVNCSTKSESPAMVAPGKSSSENHFTAVEEWSEVRSAKSPKKKKVPTATLR